MLEMLRDKEISVKQAPEGTVVLSVNGKNKHAEFL